MNVRASRARATVSRLSGVVLIALVLLPGHSHAQMECGSASQAMEQISTTVAGPLFTHAFGPWGDAVGAAVGVHFTEAPADVFERCWREAEESEEEDDDGYDDTYGLLDPPDEDDGDGDGWSWGDPHVLTFDGLEYDFHGAGDYVLLEHAPTRSAVHTRYVRSLDRRVSAQQALAIGVGDRVVTLYEVPPTEAEPIAIDGVPTAFQPGGWYEDDDLRIQRVQQWIFVRFSNGLTVATVSGRTNRIHVPSAWAGELIGLMGNRDGNPANDVAHRDGTAVDPSDADALYGGFLDDWLVAPQASLFAEPFDVAAMGPLRPDSVPSLAELDNETIVAATEVCERVGLQSGRGLEACVFDVAWTGDESWASADGALATRTLTSGSVMPNVTRLFELGDGAVAGTLEAVGVAHDVQVPAHNDDAARVLASGQHCDSATPATVAIVVGGIARSERRLTCDTSVELPPVAHTLRVTDPSGGTADYAFNVSERILSPTIQAGSIEPNVPVSIPIADNRQQWRWTIDEGNPSMFIQSGALSRAEDSTASVCNARWSVIDLGGSALHSGSLCIDAANIDVTGAAYLVVDIPADVGAGFVPGYTATGAESTVTLTDRVRLDGSLGSPGQVDTWRLDIEPGTSLLLMNEGGSNDCGIVWSILENNIEVFSGASCFDSDPVTLTAGGNVQIRVDAASAFGDYGLDIIRVPEPGLERLSVSEVLDASISVPGEVVRFAIDANAEDELLLTNTTEGTPNCRVVWRVLGPAESGGMEDAVFEGPSCFDTEPIRLPRTGQYIVEVDGNRSATGSVLLTAHSVPAPTMSTLRFGEEMDASIRSPGARVRLTFDANAGDELTLREGAQDNTECGIAWRVLGPYTDDAVVFEGASCFDSPPIAIESSGSYILETDGERSDTGAVGVLVERR